ncbi:diguanylate cyclase (GGDEF) domain-containing protein [Pseudidiomarina indica]|uniref:diguanylate cyclase n=1 Tax=Pseudidiomarina indica TaxID=1159017 RepID=A0A1G6DB13_9GAMM|nr:diguanylate cyclase [Pseudidiomarina indica]SDB42373.1 diguanylate cyclase (GGDEF) domain-containing protein [Pseudidiomarina indica]
MSNHAYRWVGWLLLLICWGSVMTAARANVVTPTIYYQSTAAEQTLAELIASPAERWQEIPAGEAVQFGYTQNTYWFHVQAPAANHDRILYLGYPLLDSIDVYFVQKGELLNYSHLGDQQPFYARPIHNKNFIVAVPTHAEHDIYLRVRTESSLRFPIELWEPVAFMQAYQNQVVATGLYFGLLACMAMYNLFYFLVTREVNFLNYSIYTVLIGLLIAGLDGLGYQYVWPNSVWLQDRIVTMIGAAMMLFATLVSTGILQTKTQSPRIHTWLRLFMWIYAITFVLSIFVPYGTLIPFVLFVAVIGSLYMLACGIVLWHKGLIYARIYTLALSALLATICINALGYLGLFESVFVQRYAIMAASAFEVLLLSWVLAIRFNDSRKQQLKLQETLNYQLEDMVAQRTEELERVMVRLQRANQELEQRSNEDGLTGLYNRRYLNQEFKREFRRCVRNGSVLTVMMLDIDHFKALNDRYGHLLGDQVLIELAHILKRNLRRASDTLYRYGGEEFTILLPDTDKVGARELAYQIATAVREHEFDTDHGPLKITVSIGVAVAAAGDYDQPTQLLAVADEALYRAKAAGRDQIRIIAEPEPPATSPSE